MEDIGVTHLGKQVHAELRQRNGQLQVCDVPLHFAIEAAFELYKAEGQRGARADADWYIVAKRKPRILHKPFSLAGPSSEWRTSCGDGFNLSTMILQRLSERFSDRYCKNYHGIKC